MKYSLERSYEILDRTPAVLQALLFSLPDDWIMPNEGRKPFSPYDVVGHLIHGEATELDGPGKMILEFGLAKEPSNAGTEQPCTKEKQRKDDAATARTRFRQPGKKHGLVPGVEPGRNRPG